ncbi:MAG TPA: hypothetical protein VK947_07725 [Planococcus sp. (in: firmicutes)]|nr:hypothetical protein [Planococcus sp. (in: firmicutes)]
MTVMSVTPVIGSDQSHEYSYEKAEEIELFEKAIENAAFHTGPVTALAPDYRVTVLGDNGEQQHYLVWLSLSGRCQQIPGEKPGVYLMRDEDTKKLQALFQAR